MRGCDKESYIKQKIIWTCVYKWEKSSPHKTVCGIVLAQSQIFRVTIGLKKKKGN